MSCADRASRCVGIEAVSYLQGARVLLKSTGPVTPIVVRTDQSSAFIGGIFAEYVLDLYSRSTRLVWLTIKTREFGMRPYLIVMESQSSVECAMHASCVRHMSCAYAYFT